MNTHSTFSLTTFLRLATLAAWLMGFLWLFSSTAAGGALRYEAFLSERLWPLIAGGLVLTVCFFAATYARIGRRPSHGHTLLRWSQTALLLLPLIYMTAIDPSRALGSEHMRRQAGAGLGLPGLSGSLNFQRGELTILDLLQQIDRFEGQEVTLLGQVAHRDGEDVFDLFRFVMACCVADVIPVWVVVPFDGDDLPEDAWVRVSGIPRKITVAGEEQVVLEPIHSETGPGPIERVPAPSNIFILL